MATSIDYGALPVTSLGEAGVRPDATKGLIAIEDGYRESTESWRRLRDAGLRRRPLRDEIASR